MSHGCRFAAESCHDVLALPDLSGQMFSLSGCFVPFEGWLQSTDIITSNDSDPQTPLIRWQSVRITHWLTANFLCPSMLLAILLLSKSGMSIKFVNAILGLLIDCINPRNHEYSLNVSNIMVQRRRTLKACYGWAWSLPPIFAWVDFFMVCLWAQGTDWGIGWLHLVVLIL